MPLDWLGVVDLPHGAADLQPCEEGLVSGARYVPVQYETNLTVQYIFIGRVISLHMLALTRKCTRTHRRKSRPRPRATHSHPQPRTQTQMQQLRQEGAHPRTRTWRHMHEARNPSSSGLGTAAPRGLGIRLCQTMAVILNRCFHPAKLLCCN